MLNNFIQFKGVVSGEIEYQIINLDVYILISYQNSNMLKRSGLIDTELKASVFCFKQLMKIVWIFG